MKRKKLSFWVAGDRWQVKIYVISTKPQSKGEVNKENLNENLSYKQ